MPELSASEKKAILVIIFFFIIGAGVRLYPLYFGAENNIAVLNQNDEPLPTSNPLKLPEYEATPEEKREKVKDTVAHICGEVYNPGVYTLPSGSRVQDFLEAAGGSLQDADMNKINLARVVEDGEQIRVPSVNEILTPDSTPGPAGSTGNTSPGSTGDTSSGSQTGDGKININTATIGELDNLPGIGPVIAQRVVEYRQEKGNFKKIEDIKNVKGIGEKIFENIKDLIVI